MTSHSLAEGTERIHSHHIPICCRVYYLFTLVLCIPRYEDDHDMYNSIMVKALADRLAEVHVVHISMVYHRLFIQDGLHLFLCFTIYYWLIWVYNLLSFISHVFLTLTLLRHLQRSCMRRWGHVCGAMPVRNSWRPVSYTEFLTRYYILEGGLCLMCGGLW